MTREYTYAAIGDRYYCVQSGLLSLAWILLFKYNTLQLSSLGIQRRQIPRILKSLFTLRLRGRPLPEDTITLPAFGHLGMRVHQGHKTFNFLDLTATKLFDKDVDVSDATSEINSARKASPLDFAPTILATGPESRWYTETFITGRRSGKNEASQPGAIFARSVAGLLRAIAQSRPMRAVNLQACLADLHHRLSQRLAEAQIADELRANLQTFVSGVTSRLKTMDDVPVHLAFTHGDFSFVNFIYRDNRIFVVDWEGAGRRSLLHDLFNYFFTELYYARTGDDLVGDIDDAADALLSDLGVDRDLPERTDIRTVYRLIYYLERLCMLLERDVSENRSRVIQRSIDVFTAHERITTGSRTPQSP